MKPAVDRPALDPENVMRALDWPDASVCAGRPAKPKRPVVSVIVALECAKGDGKTRDHLRRALRALARQDLDKPLEVLVVEATTDADQLPGDLRTLLPSQ